MASDDALESLLGVQFQNPQLIRQALVHRSLLNEQDESPLDSYERLEFLGDSVLGLVVSTELFQKHPDLAEGDLTRERSALVCGESLAQVARRLELGRFLRLGKGEEATGGRERDSNLAAVFEAVVAAVYLDGGYAAARRFVLRIMAPELAQHGKQGTAAWPNPKSALQEYLQGLGRPAPRYRVVAAEGPDHSPTFTVDAVVEEEVIGQGRAGKKADAERAAALDALERLRVNGVGAG
ncbi:MAG: ribonuclease III [SAR202 cluster bacterium]|nr:ribonuclease III [SAR202 cluster bacterium]